MTTEERLLTATYALEQLITEREGMIATNKDREHRGEVMAHDEEAFFRLAERFSATARLYGLTP